MHGNVATSKRVGGMTPEEFVQKWSKAQLSERRASQRMLSRFTPPCLAS